MKVALHILVMLAILAAVIGGIWYGERTAKEKTAPFYRDRDALEEVVRIYQRAAPRQVLIDHYRAESAFTFTKDEAEDPDLLRAPLYDLVSDAEAKARSEACIRELYERGFLSKRVARKLLDKGYVNLAPAIEIPTNPAVVIEEDRFFYVFWVDGSTDTIWRAGHAPDS